MYVGAPCRVYTLTRLGWRRVSSAPRSDPTPATWKRPDNRANATYVCVYVMWMEGWKKKMRKKEKGTELPVSVDRVRQGQRGHMPTENQI